MVNGSAAQLGSYTVTTTNANGCVSLPSTVLVVTAAKNSIAGIDPVIPVDQCVAALG